MGKRRPQRYCLNRKPDGAVGGNHAHLARLVHRLLLHPLRILSALRIFPFPRGIPPAPTVNTVGLLELAARTLTGVMENCRARRDCHEAEVVGCRRYSVIARNPGFDASS